jgi:hypothetical protein
MEDKIEILEALLEAVSSPPVTPTSYSLTCFPKVQPGVDFSSVLGPPIIRDSWKESESHAQDSPHNPLFHQSMPLVAPNSLVSSPSLYPSPPFIPTSPHNPSAGLFSRPEALSHSTHLFLVDPPSLQPLSPRSTPPNAQPPEAHSPESDHTSSEYSDSHLDRSDSDDAYEGDGETKLLLPTNAAQPRDTNWSRFHGTSSSVILVAVTKNFKKNTLLGLDDPGYPAFKSPSPPSFPDSSLRRPQFWKTPRVRHFFSYQSSLAKSCLDSGR